jgi:hypothetical protein
MGSGIVVGLPRGTRRQYCLTAAAIVWLHFCLLTAAVSAAELKKRTVEAFDRYVQVTEARMATELTATDGFLWLDQMPAQRHQAIQAQLQQGRVIVESLGTRESGKHIHIPDGLVHHWVAVVFVPGATLQESLAFLRDYDHHQEIYKPDVQRSKLLSAEGDDFRVYFRLYRKTIVTAAYNTEFDVRYFSLDATRAYSRSYATRIAEVVDPGKPTEREKPVGRDRGYLWRLNTYWRYEERDGGVYIQIEFIALSRSVPAIFAWLVNPYIKSVPREYLAHLLGATRSALMKRNDNVSSLSRISGLR